MPTLIPGQTVPDLELQLTIQARFELSKQKPDTFTMLVFYRGKHCPICKKYLEELGGKVDRFTALGVSPFAISMDSKDRAMVAHEDWDTHDLPLAYGLPEDQARDWGLYISEKRPDSDEPERFSEPGLFLITPDGTLFLAQTQSAPFTRPPLDELLSGIELVRDKDYPTRGTAT
ncbi:peroxiredoxin-like family protein [Alteriqipengyuania lutimaris]|uniref:AhpC/TSA family protein n=1 Tax=Alteriqipengyuania lutimaris TaxID=1538146 RepID=A0A395LR71_9SPHN|nr:peroxiredoxin-like family protein [Alteriqipengyuania lutimaris]MBB3032877.1 peroxiredoxin [Alteriqipengyuania lutimaris]RDS78034.1 AhpC/TSA family protein [Alteriqipengyuania lutimaris]